MNPVSLVHLFQNDMCSSETVDYSLDNQTTDVLRDLEQVSVSKKEVTSNSAWGAMSGFSVEPPNFLGSTVMVTLYLFKPTASQTPTRLARILHNL